MRMKNRKERGEPGKIYHVKNVIGRENLIQVGERMNSPMLYGLNIRESFMADRMGLGSTMLRITMYIGLDLVVGLVCLSRHENFAAVREVLASFPGPAQLSVTCSTERW